MVKFNHPYTTLGFGPRSCFIPSRMSELIPNERIENKIYLIRGKKVMLDRDLAVLYGVKTHVLNQAVKRNRERFPEDFMFKLTLMEAKSLISQFVISNVGRGGLRHAPIAFTEQGVAMLSSVLNSKQAIAVNIQIIRTFTKLHEIIAGNEYVLRRLEALEKQSDEQFRVVFDAIHRLLATDEESKEEIGFKT